MNGTTQRPSRILSARRIGLLATTIAGLGAAACSSRQNLAPNAAFFAAPAHAQNLSQQAQQLPQHPVGFADIVAKVKPAVISVRVKMEIDDGGQPRIWTWLQFCETVSRDGHYPFGTHI